MSDYQMENYSLWEQDYYQQPVGELGMSYQGFCDSNTNFDDQSKNMTWIPDEKTSTNVDVNGRNNTYTRISSPEKGKRRRTKGGPSQSTTFLNASIKDFRALVQQHTGCHNTNSSPKGPITLCFGSPSISTHDQAYQLNHQYYA